MCSVFLVVFSFINGRRKTKTNGIYVIILLWIGGAIALTLIRSILISILIGISISIVLSSSRAKRTMIMLSIMFVFILGGSFLTKMIIGADLLQVVADRFSVGYQYVEQGSGTYEYRKNSVKLRLNYMIENNPLFGQGYKGTYYDRAFQVSHLYDPTIAEGDNIIANICVTYGLSGFVIIIWLLYTVFYKAINLFRTFPLSWQKSVVTGILAFNIQMVFVSVFSSIYVQIWGILILAPSWAVIELLDRFYIRGDILMARNN
jgi:hypothetical protein